MKDRLDIIFEELAKGKLADEITETLIREQRVTEVPALSKKKESKKRRIQPVPPEINEVVHVLEHVEGVRYVRRGHRGEDALANRFVVGVNFLGSHMQEITAEIRSHGNALRGFRRKLAQQLQEDAYGVGEYLTQQGVVLLHARLSEADIVTKFHEQCARIGSLHSARN